MDVTYGKNINHIVTSAWLAGMPVLSIWLNGEKLYPIEGNVVQQLVVDTAFGSVDSDLIYWMHALNWHDKMPKEKVKTREEVRYPGPWTTGTDSELIAWMNWVRQMQQAGWSYSASDPFVVYKETGYKEAGLFELVVGEKVYKEGVDFTFNPNTGFIEFTGSSQLPDISALQVGEKARLRASVPARTDATAHLGTSYYALPILPGTRFYCWYLKGGKKDPGGMILTVNGTPSNETFLYSFGNLAGHWTGAWAAWTPPSGLGNYVWNGCNCSNKWTPGDTGYSVQVQSYYGGGQQATPHYPAFDKEWMLDVVGVVIKQV